jgi:ABC-type oligopeptide transport system substrate-binding subunit
VSPQIAWFKYQRGELDVAGIPRAELPARPDRSALRAAAAPPGDAPHGLPRVNCTLPPFDRVAVRQAMNLAIDKTRLVELLDGQATPPRRSSARDAGWRPSGVRARSRDGATPAGGGGTRGRLQDDALDVSRGLPDAIRAVDPARPARHRVTLDLKPVDFPRSSRACARGTVPAFIAAWGADSRPVELPRVLFHSRARGTNNNSFYSNPAVDRISTRRPVLDPERRFALFHVRRR